MAKYLVLPVNNRAERVKLDIISSEQILYSLDIKYDSAEPAYSAYINIERFTGREITPMLPGGIRAKAEFADDLPTGTYAEPHRPQVHFTAAYGWTNDPNGLIYTGGRYHMFFQHNPAGTEWGNMHWGHAVSCDLAHWDYLGDALFPDSLGTIFSGSAILDEHNVSGLGKNGEPPILLFYTAAGNPFTQCLAYSTDSGETFEKYASNPIVGHIAAENRDPKVIWCDELGKYVMALYLEGSEYILLGSDNLLDWNEFQRLSLPGDGECPDFYPMLLDGTHRKWVFSGAADYYFVGEIKDGKYVPDGPEKRLFGQDRQSYAAQTFSGLSGYRRVRIAWNTVWHNFSDSPFSMSMTFPAELELRTIGGIPTLCARPVREIESLFIEGQADAYFAEFDIDASEHASVHVCGVNIPLPFTGQEKVQLIVDRGGWELYTLDSGHYYIGGVAQNERRLEYGNEKITVNGEEIQGAALHRLASIWKK
jgi:Beta-fructosidases (levanase/invertase)